MKCKKCRSREGENWLCGYCLNCARTELKCQFCGDQVVFDPIALSPYKIQDEDYITCMGCRMVANDWKLKRR
jgi:hypothetical protein